MDKIILKRLEVECIIGIFRHERVRKQKIWIDVEVPCDTRRAAATDRVKDTFDYKRLAKEILNFAARSRFFLVETLAEKLAERVLKLGAPSVKLTVWKPGAIRFSENVGVSIERSSNDAARCEAVYLLIGSNVDKEKMIPAAIEALRARWPELRVSSVYESPAVGGAPQPPFWNAVAEFRAVETPAVLRAELKKIENRLGRQRVADKYAPRRIDLDLVFYGSKVSRSLKLPHPDSEHAPYILVPMAELNSGFTHPAARKTVLELAGAQMALSRDSFTKVG